MTVAKLIAHLQTMPQEAECFCLEEKRRGYSTFTEFKDLTFDDLDLTDLRGNPFVEPDSPHFGSLFLNIGSK